ncbi:hypothetical protein MRB53_041398 [Persea americana]|nr:hypothetical protein MRB53_041398 [Persea americana]
MRRIRGEDQWMDMIQSEEKKMKSQGRSVYGGADGNGKGKKKDDQWMLATLMLCQFFVNFSDILRAIVAAFAEQASVLPMSNSHDDGPRASEDDHLQTRPTINFFVQLPQATLTP